MAAYNSRACPVTSSFWSMAGQACAIVLSSVGAAYGTAKTGAAMGAAGLANPAALTKLTLPVIMAGVLSIYGLITSLTINSRLGAFQDGLPLYISYSHFAAGLSTGLASLAAGIAIGVAGSSAVGSVAKQGSLFVVMLVTMIFSEALALYGLIVGLILASRSGEGLCAEL